MRRRATRETLRYDWYTGSGPSQNSEQPHCQSVTTERKRLPISPSDWKQVFDERGNLTWSMDGSGFTIHEVFRPRPRAMLQQIDMRTRRLG